MTRRTSGSAAPRRGSSRSSCGARAPSSGRWLAGRVLAAHQLPAAAGQPVTYDWQAIWSLPAWGAVAVLALFVLAFRNPARDAQAPSGADVASSVTTAL